jgi:REP element-mobilizing transposase RayT
MAEEVAKRGGILIRQNAMPDHAHLLVRLKPNILVSDFIGEVKGGTTYRYNREASIEARLARRIWRGDVARRRSGEGIEIHR